MLEALKYISVIIFAYLIGNINPALIISKIKRNDVRTLGSGNPGTMNMVRNFGVVIGATTLILDILKGVIPALVGWLILGKHMSLQGDKIGIYVGGLSVVVGHMFPVFMKFRGGKGIATTFGFLFVASPIPSAIVLFCVILFFIVVRIAFVTSFLGIYTVMAIESLIHPDLRFSLFFFALFLLTMWAHRKNIIKLLSGQEKRIKLRK